MPDQLDDTADPNNEDWKMLWGFIRFASGLGGVFVIIVLLFAGAGFLADKYLGAGNLGLVIAITIGAVCGLFWSYLRVSKMLKIFFPPRKPASEDTPKTS